MSKYTAVEGKNIDLEFLNRDNPITKWETEALHLINNFDMTTHKAKAGADLTLKEIRNGIRALWDNPDFKHAYENAADATNVSTGLFSPSPVNFSRVMGPYLKNRNDQIKAKNDMAKFDQRVFQEAKDPETAILNAEDAKTAKAKYAEDAMLEAGVEGNEANKYYSEQAFARQIDKMSPKFNMLTNHYKLYKAEIAGIANSKDIDDFQKNIQNLQMNEDIPEGLKNNLLESIVGPMMENYMDEFRPENIKNNFAQYMDGYLNAKVKEDDDLLAQAHGNQENYYKYMAEEAKKAEEAKQKQAEEDQKKQAEEQKEKEKDQNQQPQPELKNEQPQPEVKNEQQPEVKKEEKQPVKKAPVAGIKLKGLSLKKKKNNPQVEVKVNAPFEINENYFESKKDEPKVEKKLDGKINIIEDYFEPKKDDPKVEVKVNGPIVLDENHFGPKEEAPAQKKGFLDEAWILSDDDEVVKEAVKENPSKKANKKAAGKPKSAKKSKLEQELENVEPIILDDDEDEKEVPQENKQEVAGEHKEEKKEEVPQENKQEIADEPKEEKNEEQNGAVKADEEEIGKNEEEKKEELPKENEQQIADNEEEIGEEKKDNPVVQAEDPKEKAKVNVAPEIEKDAVSAIFEKYVPEELRSEVKDLGEIFDYLTLDGVSLNEAPYAQLTDEEKMRLYMDAVKENDGVELIGEEKNEAVQLDKLSQEVPAVGKYIDEAKRLEAEAEAKAKAEEVKEPEQKEEVKEEEQKGEVKEGEPEKEDKALAPKKEENAEVKKVQKAAEAEDAPKKKDKLHEKFEAEYSDKVHSKDDMDNPKVDKINFGQLTSAKNASEKKTNDTRRKRAYSFDQKRQMLNDADKKKSGAVKTFW